MRCVPSWVKTIGRMSRAAIRQISRDDILAYAGQASFFVVISAIPFLLLLLSALRYLMPEELATVLDYWFQFLPDASFEAVVPILDELQRESNVPILSISGMTLLWASSRGIRSISEGIMNVYGTRLSISFWKKHLLAVIMTLLLIAAIIASVTAMLFRDQLEAMLPMWSGDGYRLLAGVRFLVFLFALTCVFVVLFSVLGERGLPVREHLTGALFASLGWNVFSWGYGYYVNEIANISRIYGSLSAVVLLMLWVYCCMTILLLGAEINAWMHQISQM